MNLLDDQTVNPLLHRARRYAGVVAVSLLLASGLSACGNDADNTTCGEYLDKSDSERTAFLKDAVKDEANSDELKQIEAAGDEVYGVLAESVATTCEGQDKDKKLGDIADDLD